MNYDNNEVREDVARATRAASAKAQGLQSVAELLSGGEETLTNGWLDGDDWKLRTRVCHHIVSLTAHGRPLYLAFAEPSFSWSVLMKFTKHPKFAVQVVYQQWSTPQEAMEEAKSVINHKTAADFDAAEPRAFAELLEVAGLADLLATEPRP